jgi:hypothetical protein
VPEEEETGGVRAALWLVLEHARIKLTQRQILEQWPPDHPKPAPAYLWRLLGRAVEHGELKREGIGIKADAYRYWLAALEDRWQHDAAARLEQTMLDNKRDLMRRLPELFDRDEPD